MGKRLFVAVDLDLAGTVGCTFVSDFCSAGQRNCSCDYSRQYDEIAGVQSEFDGISGLRYTDPEQAHITLKISR